MYVDMKMDAQMSSDGGTAEGKLCHKEREKHACRGQLRCSGLKADEIFT